MNAKHFQRLNPHFKFNKIFLFNQTKFYSQGIIKKFLYPLNKENSNNKFINELNEEKNFDYLTQQLISEYKNENNKKNENNNIKSKKMKEIRSKLVKNNNVLKQMDFNLNNKVLDIKKDSFELDINSYHNLSPRINKNKRTINLTENNNILNQRMQNKPRNDISENKSYEGLKTVFDNLKLPYIKTSINRRSCNISSLNKNIENPKNINDNNEKDKAYNDNIIEVKKDGIKKDMQRDIFKNINYLIDNKKTQLNIYDIKRNIYDFKNMNDKEEENKKFYSKLFINTKTPKTYEMKSSQNFQNSIADTNEDNKFINEKIKEKEKYIIYEQNKKYIDKNKICDAMKYRAANIPNLSLDKGFRDVKKFEKNVLNMKKEQTDLPFFKAK